jgi:hypothetical protein
VIDASLIQSIRDLADEASSLKTVQVNGEEYARRPLHRLKEPELEQPDALVVHSLRGLVDYISENKDGLNLSEYTLHVVNPGRVDLVSTARGTYFQRSRFVTAENYDRFAACPQFRFGSFLDLETMNVSLQALFEDSGDRAALLKLLASIKDEASIAREDDGTTQRVTARAGIAFAQEVKVPNPVTLAPYRTFPDVGPQPASSFVFRLKSNGNDVTAALFEADGGAWRDDATELVAKYLRVTLGDTELAVSGLSIIA